MNTAQGVTGARKEFFCFNGHSHNTAWNIQVNKNTHLKNKKTLQPVNYHLYFTRLSVNIEDFFNTHSTAILSQEQILLYMALFDIIKLL